MHRDCVFWQIKKCDAISAKSISLPSKPGPTLTDFRRKKVSQTCNALRQFSKARFEMNLRPVPGISKFSNLPSHPRPEFFHNSSLVSKVAENPKSVSLSAPHTASHPRQIPKNPEKSALRSESCRASAEGRFSRSQKFAGSTVDRPIRS